MTRLRELIEEKNMMQKKVADDLGYPRSTFNNYICDQRELDHEGICKVCDYFGCTADYLLGRSSARLPVISDNEAALLEAFKAAPENMQDGIRTMLAPYMVAEEKKRA